MWVTGCYCHVRVNFNVTTLYTVQLFTCTVVEVGDNGVGVGVGHKVQINPHT